MDTKRAKLIADLFGDSKGFLSRGKILKFDKKLSSIATDQLIDFSIFADQFRGEFLNSDLVIHKAIIAWHKNIFMSIKRPGIRYFNDMQSLKEFIKEAFKMQILCSGGAGSGFLPYAKIFVDDNGELRNSCVVLENGTYKRLDGDECEMIYNYLFANQDKIGYVENITREEYEKLERGQEQQQIEYKSNAANNSVKMLVNKAIKRI